MAARVHTPSLKLTTIMLMTLMGTLGSKPLFGQGLCKSNEETVFSCGVRRDRTVSICRASGVVPNKLAYRFGSPQKVELEHIDNVGPESSFFYGFYSRPLTMYFDLGFRKGEYTYTISYRYSGDFPDPSYNLTVAMPGGERKFSKLECLRSIENKGLTLVRDVSCSREEVLGCDER